VESPWASEVKGITKDIKTSFLFCRIQHASFIKICPKGKMSKRKFIELSEVYKIYLMKLVTME
jgi:hypothetical protein